MSANLQKMARAAEAENWRGAVLAARAQKAPLALRDLLKDSDLALRVAWVAMLGPCTLTAELARVFALDVGADGPATDVPSVIHGRLFSESLAAFRDAFRDRNTRVTERALIVLICLPGASNARALHLRAALEELVDVVAADQARADSEALGSSDALRPNAFPIAVQTYAALAQADLYPEISCHFLRSYLRVAEYSSLRFWRTALALIAWPDLMEIRGKRSELLDLSPAGRDWLYQITGQDKEEDAPEQATEDDS